MHFDNRFGNYNGRVFSKQVINTLSLVALFMLLIASVNFINLATAQAVNRSKEMRVRKVLGSRRTQLVVQFLCEVGLIALFAVFTAVVLAKITLPFLN